MNSFPRYFALLSAVLLCQSLFAEETSISFDEEQLKALESGEVLLLPPGKENMVLAAIRIDAPTALVWSTMMDQERIPKYVKQVRAIEVLEKGDNWKIIEQKLKMHPLLPKLGYVFREEYGPGYQINFKRVRGAFRELTGSWKLIPDEGGEHVILIYSTYVELGWYVPKSWIRNGINKDVPKLLKAFRNEVYIDLPDFEAEESET